MTFIAFDPASRRHDLPGHPETAARAERILAAFDADPIASKLARLGPDRLLTRDEALTVHTPRLWLNLETAAATGPVHLDPDTYVVPGSWEAARGTARLSLQAVERSRRNQEGGFVVARPPGHHATSDRSMGFCHFNNVALAAEHALRLGTERILVFDHDVHHGNGTQEIFYGSRRVLYQSFHLWPHYPGSGAVEEIGVGEGNGFTMNAPLGPGTGDAEVRGLLLDVFLPAAKEFRPQLILVSSGFDSLAGDPLGGLGLSAPFFGEMVHRLVQVCPRTVCFLEGGYQLDRIPEAALAEVHALAGHAPRPGAEVRPTPSGARLKRLLAPRWASVGGPQQRAFGQS